MLLLTLLSAALAQSPLPALTKHIETAPHPAWAIACSPTSDLIEILKQVPLYEQRPQAGWSPAQRVLIPLVKPGGLSEAGIDPTGTLLASGGAQRSGKETNSVVSIPFAGDAEQAGVLVNRLFKDVKAGEAAGTWSAVVDDQAMHIALTDGALLGRSVDAKPHRADPHPALLSGLPETPGCAIYVSVDEMPLKPKLRLMMPMKLHGASLFVPTQGGTGLVRVSTDLELGEATGVETIKHIYGTSTRPPSAVVVWTVDPLLVAGGILAKLPAERGPIGALKEMTADPQNRPFRIPPGMVTAIWGSDEDKDFVTAIPIRSRRGWAIPVRRLRRSLTALLTEMKAPVEPKSKTGLVIGSAGKEHAHIELRRGLIIVGTDPGLVREAATGHGRPWVSPKLLGLTQASAVAAEVHVPPSDEAPGAEARIGVAVTEGMLEVKVQANVAGAGGQGIAALLQTIAKLRPEELERLSRNLVENDARGQLEHDMRRLRNAVAVHETEHEVLLTAGPWPRALDALSPGPAPWVSASPDDAFQGFGTLDWAPEASPLLGTYWVEIGEDSKTFTVWGALDLDGDGVPARYKLVRGLKGEVEQVTEDGVY